MNDKINDVIKPVVKNEVLSLFSVPVGRYMIPTELTKKQTNFILKQTQRNNLGNTTSTNHNILERKELQSLKQSIFDKVIEFFKQVYDPKYDVTLRITQSWINYTKQGQFHHKHRHPNSYISGIYYVDTIETDKVFFHNDRSQTIDLPPSSWNNWNSKSWWLEATKGTLIIFPSFLEHNVETLNSDHTRISLSFNTFPVGTIGEEQDLTGLKLEG